ncbi:MAG: FG-GAP-like repeat-containing protein [Sandaracinaceae bacterium]
MLVRFLPSGRLPPELRPWPATVVTLRRNAAYALLVLLSASVGTGCYLSHERRISLPDAEVDAALDASTPAVDASTPDDAGCCSLACQDRAGNRTVCSATQSCTATGCAPSCAFATCDGVCCLDGELCGSDGSCQVPERECLTDRECGEGLLCEPLTRRCVVPPNRGCRFEPPVGEFRPEIQWEYTDHNVISMPIIVQLTDDDRDGDRDAADTPDVVVATYDQYDGPTSIVALSGDDGRVLWETGADVTVCPFTTLAAADLEGDGAIEIVAVIAEAGSLCRLSTDNQVDIGVFSNDGALIRRLPVEGDTKYGAINLADFDGDGQVEILAVGTLLRHDGTVVWRVEALNGLTSAHAVADLDGDGRLEVAASDFAVDDNGDILWRSDPVPDGHAVVARIIETSGSTGPQVVSVNGDRLQVFDGATGRSLFGPLFYERSAGLAGPPTVADFDADGLPEIGVAGERRYLVFDLNEPPTHTLWSVRSEDLSTGSVGSTVFDFDADGSAEVVYGDECRLQILDGRTGRTIWDTLSPSGTVLEYPVVVDVDGDGNAELVAVSNIVPGSDPIFDCGRRSRSGIPPNRGVRVYRDRLDNWVSTRTVWNQHAFHIDNIDENGRVPRDPPRSWERHNTYRLNQLADARSATYAPDLAITAAEATSAGCGAARIRARVEQRGARGVAAGLQVAAYTRDGTLVGTGTTAGTLVPGAAEWVAFDLDLPTSGLGDGSITIVADDDGTGRGSHSECDETNNRFSAVTLRCPG